MKSPRKRVPRQPSGSPAQPATPGSAAARDELRSPARRSSPPGPATACAVDVSDSQDAGGQINSSELSPIQFDFPADFAVTRSDQIEQTPTADPAEAGERECSLP